MGFSLYLHKIGGDRLIDPDRGGVQEFLWRRRMHMKVIPASSTGRSSFATLLNEDGSAINVDGLQDFHFSYVLEEDEAMTAGTGHAHLTITQGMSEADQRQDIVAVNSGEELQALLTGRLQSFLDWCERAFTRLGLNSSGPEPSPSA